VGVNFRYPILAPRRNPTAERMGTTTTLLNVKAVIPNPPGPRSVESNLLQDPYQNDPVRH
jgi:hypothetical protein